MEGADVTAQRQLEDRLRQSEKMESLGRLAGGIAHDFNNILAAILGYAELLAGDVAPGSEAAEHVDHVLSAAHRARDLVRQILTFSRKSEVRRETVDLRATLRDALTLLRASSAVTIEIRAHVTDEVLLVAGDIVELSQVLLSLGSNAQYAMRAQAHGVLDVRTSMASSSTGTTRRARTWSPGATPASGCTIPAEASIRPSCP